MGEIGEKMVKEEKNKKIKVTDSVKYALRAWGMTSYYSGITLKGALKKGFIGVKNGKYYVTAKGEKARPTSTNNI